MLLFSAEQLQIEVAKAVAFLWATRREQIAKQNTKGQRDQGYRGAVTGGAQMDGFLDLITKLVVGAGIDKSCLFRDKHLELPGYFGPQKKWDFLIVKDSQLLAALEFKSQVGPSFGNNFNNRAEEAIGSAVTFGPHTMMARLTKQFDPGLDTYFYWNSVRLQTSRFVCANHISKFFQSSGSPSI